jgi:Fe-S cluster assembly protein SufB
MTTETQTIEQLATQEYKFGFTSDVEQDIIAPGLSEDTVRFISARKNEPEWMLEWRLKASATG